MFSSSWVAVSRSKFWDARSMLLCRAASEDLSNFHLLGCIGGCRYASIFCMVSGMLNQFGLAVGCTVGLVIVLV